MSSARDFSDRDRLILESFISRYALRFHLSEQDTRLLVSNAIEALAAQPRIFFEKSVEQAVAETVDTLVSSTGLAIP